MKVKFFVLCTLCFMVLSGCGSQQQESNTEETTGILTEQTTTEKVTTEEMINLEELVTNTRSASYELTIYGEKESYQYEIPQINLEGEYIQNINKEIYDSLNSYVEETDGLFGSSEVTYPPSCKTISYEWSVHGEILSLLIDAYMDDFNSEPYNKYYIYNIDLQSKVILDCNEVVERYGMELSEYKRIVKEALGSEWWKSGAEVVKNAQDNGVTEKEMQPSLSKTIGDSNVAEAKPYINQDGELCITGIVYWFAGGGYHPCRINLERYEKHPAYSEIVVIGNTSEEATTETKTTEKITGESVDKSQLIGTWKIDDEKTMEVNDVSMWALFGSAYSDYGCEMVFGKDDTFSYYVGAGIGGSGNYEIKETDISYKITTYEEQSEETGNMIFTNNYIVMDFAGYQIYWCKINDSKDSGSTSDVKLEQLCQRVADYYNKKFNSTDYVVFAEECVKTKEGYLLSLRYQGGMEANSFVADIQVNTITGVVEDSLGESWSL